MSSVYYANPAESVISAYVDPSAPFDEDPSENGEEVSIAHYKSTEDIPNERALKKLMRRAFESATDQVNGCQDSTGLKGVLKKSSCGRIETVDSLTDKEIWSKEENFTYEFMT
eukprot:6637035-Ditylum_brightwellii.AAC.1